MDNQTNLFVEQKKLFIRFINLFVLCLCGSLLFTTHGVAVGAKQNLQKELADASNSAANITEKSVTVASWESAAPIPDKFDWIQLTSGEWLKGELNVLYDNVLEFDSDELDLLQLDWEDIKQVLGHQPHSVQFEGDIIVVGLLRIKGNKVIILDGEKKQEFDRERLISIAQGIPKEINYWSAKISLNLNVSRGNTDQLEYGSIINVRRRTAASRAVLDYIGNITQTDDVETANNQRINGFYDIFETRHFYWRPVFMEYYRDRFQNIDYRTTLGAGAGYQIIDTSKTEWDITPGLAYQYTRYVSVEEGENIGESTPALVIGTSLDIELSKISDLIVNYRLQYGKQESGGYTHHFLTTLENEIITDLDFDISFVWDRIQNPRPNEEGIVPKKDDLRLLIGLGFDF